MARERGQFVAGVAGRGFTLIELLVVISIIAIGASLLVPAFGRLVQSVNYASAVNTVSAALGNARARAASGRHTAVLFQFDLESERYSLQLLELQELASGFISEYGSRRAFGFRPASGQVPVLLPKGFAVYGLAVNVGVSSTVAELDDKVTDEDAEIDTHNTCATADWYAGWKETVGRVRPLWLFPMNDPRNFMENDPPRLRFVGIDPWEVLRDSGGPPEVSDALCAVRHAQSFAIIFDPTGSVVSAPTTGNTEAYDTYVEWPRDPVDRTDPTGQAYDWPDVFDPENLGDNAPSPPGSPSVEDRSPNPEVFFRTVDQLAIVDLGRLARGTRIERPWYVRPKETGFPQPRWLDELGYFEDDVDTDDPDEMPKHRLISDWIDKNAEILSFDRYSGKVIRRESP